MNGQIKIQVHPGARRASVRGWREDGTLRLEVVEPPENGLANRAVTRLLAEALRVHRRHVSVVRGQGSRTKWVAVEGLSEAEIRRRIEEVLYGGADHGQ